LLLLLGGYWIFAWWLERINFAQVPPTYMRQVMEAYPLIATLWPLTFAAEMLSPSVLRHFIPAAAGWWLARLAMTYFLVSFYDLPGGSDKGAAMLGRLTAGPAARLRSTPIRPAHFAADARQDPLLGVGGPGRISLGAESAVVTEGNGRFVRVLGPGGHSLGRFEHPVAVIDLRPQEREAASIHLFSSDGIELAVTAGVSFRISAGEERPGKDNPFPFDAEAVRKAAYAATQTGESQTTTWDGLPLAILGDELRNLVAEYKLDELVYADQPGSHNHRRIRREVMQRAKDSLYALGIELTEVRLGRFELLDPFGQQNVDTWRASWDRRRRIRAAESEALTVEAEEVARAEGEAIMLQAIAEGLQRAERGGVVKTREIIALRMIESLEAVARQTEETAPLPASLLPTLDQLRIQLAQAAAQGEEQQG
jgi:regulator of protease activity HflC (stomatin/prohibitin superfamily)